ncbi:MAG TPA: SDR family NAD(P)-dependent oxidoreductase [Hyphomicrobiales bacterium]|nr:SDR family NAD(P)-dependent oxidoreductase [Hyphomicrobiales bacterium]
MAIVGRACRLPGAPDVAAFWDLLVSARCAVRPLDSTRWSQRRFRHPRRPLAGKTYAPAAGLLDDPFAFDPGVFGISPREAEQMDPQQRLTLELVWEALEDAGLAPGAVAGSATGVFAGASALDYAGRLSYDIPSLDPYFATGNALSIISNRVSYVFDLRGPSFTVDTACSSALVAFDEAVAALDAGRIERAVVVGVNLLLSPVSFVGFAQANMLSAQGLCRAFDAKADGYVRSEGGVVFVLERADAAAAAGRRAHAAVVAAGTNQDGRTIGLSFPSLDSQVALLRRIYDGAIDPEGLAFIEAHGTGTKAGDPVEARAVGSALAQRRSRPLPIGSVKTNVGHLEPASGLVGVLKAMLALEHDRLPPTLHVEELNPDIPFADLNLAVATEAVALPRRPGAARFAGVNSFGFGGTNAHVVIADPDPAPATTAVAEPAERPTALVLSAASREALDALARRYGERLRRAGGADAGLVARAAAHRRARLDHRAVFDLGDGPAALGRRLDEHLAGRRAAGSVAGEALGRDLPVAFVYTGNGAAWAGMGRGFLAADAAFRSRFDEIDRLFRGEAGWSLKAALEDPDLAPRLRRAEVAQPLLFAIQASATHALAEHGLKPALAFGHSVGEIAAAAAAGALTLEDAIAVIHARSVHQEAARGAGTMAALRAAPEMVAELIADPRCAGLEVAAVNSHNSVTISGSNEAIAALVKVGRERRLAVRALDLDYPFHSALIEMVEEPLVAALADIRPQPARLPFLSTVEGAALDGSQLGPAYWWRNVRAPVRFAAAIEAALDRGVRLFLEIGPRPILQAYLRETLADRETAGAVLACTDADAPERLDPIRAAVADALVHGAAIDLGRFVGPDPGPVADLPRYPWQRRRYVVQQTIEATDVFGLGGDHPLIGARDRRDAGEWFVDLDPALVPELADHKVAGNPVVPGAALIEMALAAGRDMLGSDMVELTDFEIVHALALDPDQLREIAVRYSAESRTVEILSRPRLHGDAWITHAAGRVAAFAGPVPAPPAAPAPAGETLLPGTLYGLARRHGLEFGPRFQRMAAVDRVGKERLHVRLTRRPADATQGYGLDPTELDGTFQSLIALFSGDDGRAGIAFLPSRFDQVRLYQPGRAVHRGIADIRRAGARSLACHFTLLAEDGSVVASLRNGRFRASTLVRPFRMERAALRLEAEILHDDGAAPSAVEASPADLAQAAGVAIGAEPAEDALLLDAFAAAAAEQALRAVSRDRRRFDLDTLVRQHRVAAEALPLAARLAGMMEDQDRLTRDGRFWLFDQAKRPRAETILAAILADFPEHGAEAVLGARAAALLERALAEGPAALGQPFSAATLAHAETASPAAEARIAAVDAVLGRLLVGWPVGRPLRVVELAAGAGGLTRRLVRRLGGPALSLVVTDPDAATVDRLSLGFAGTPGITFLRLDPMTPEALPPHDVVVAAGGLGRLLRVPGAAASLAKALTPGARLIAADPRPSAFLDLVHGLMPDWFQRSATPEFPLSLLRDGAEWQDELAAAGFGEVAALPLAGAASSLIVAAVPPRHEVARTPAPARRALVLPGHERKDRAWATALAESLAAAGLDAQLVEPLGSNGRSHPAEQLAAMIAADVDVIHLAGAWSSAPGAEDLVVRANAIRMLLPALHDAGARLWVVAPGALQGGAGGPAAAGLAAFARVAANEYRGLDLRLLDVEPTLPPSAAPRLAREIAAPRDDREIILAAADVRAPRLRIGTPPAPASGGAVVGRSITVGAVSGLDELAWDEAPLPEPGPGEVAVDIAATGLNFRDVMWAMGLLPDEALEDGFAGATLGLEAAGTVAAVGKGVKGFAVGDRVIGFVAGGFATRLVTPAAALAPMPKDLSFAAAATIPVAFFTAYYALIELAKLKKGERVLIHGGAGGVGLAALQIAKWRGAEVIVTAGAPEKRDFLAALGADHVLGDRDLGFADQVMALTQGQGVDVVLNSLSGDAMESSVRLVKPFGRFLELGKRDYYANTRLGLRPFRRNVSYFGIDADQLFVRQPDYAAKLFRKVAVLFDKGVLSPLPFRRFEAADVVEAFRLMQQSGHVGKIVVTPPPAAPARAVRPFRPAAEGTHLVTGGFSGFGLATARWLVARGVRNLVLVGRRGPVGAEAEAALAAFAKDGVRVHAAACDVADPAALDAVLADVRETMPPLRGVVHAAMVLDDGLLANLDYQRLAAVIRPKVAGAENLDRLTRDDPLDYFLMYSSATTFVGNPGQGNYVAANGYLEGLARRRRAEGRPALAIAWGALGDVGYLARQEAVREKLGRRVGHHAISAADALETVGRLLAQATLDPAGAVVAVAPFDWATARRELAVLASPTYREVLHGAETGAADAVETIDLAALVAGKDPREARSAVAGLLAAEVARILKLPSSDVDAARPLTQIGMDSLTALELRLNVERRFGIEMPLVAISDETTLASIAAGIVSRLVEGADDRQSREDLLARQHAGDDIAVEDLAPLQDVVMERQAAVGRVIG